MTPTDPYAPPATDSDGGYHVDRALLPAADQVWRRHSVRQTGATWEALFTEEIIYFTREDEPQAIRLHRSDFVSRTLLRGILANQVIIDLELPGKKHRFAFSKAAIPDLRQWLAASQPAYLGRSLAKGWILNSIVGLLFAASLAEEPPDLLAGVSGLFLLVGALLAKLKPLRVAFLLDAFGWLGIVVSFGLGVFLGSSSPWIMLIVVILIPAIIRDLRMFAFFAPPATG